MASKFLPPQTDSATRAANTLLKGELIFDTDNDALYYGDGATVGGVLLSSNQVTSDYVFNEVPSGAINGSNAVFTTAFAFVVDSINLFVNGIRQKAGAGNDYINTDSQTIQLSVSPEIGDIILIDYQKA